MKRPRSRLVHRIAAALPFLVCLLGGNALAQPANTHTIDPDKARVIEYWTKERRDHAMPRDLVIDPQGLGYLRSSDGSLEPYGHRITAEAAAGTLVPLAKPTSSGGTAETIPPSISNMNPANGDVIGQSYTFSATVTDASGIRSVSFVVQYPNGMTSKFSASAGANDTWTVSNLCCFTDGSWAWWAVAKDNAARGGNTATSDVVGFSVDTSGGSGGGSAGGDTDTVTSANWTNGGAVQTAAGRLYFEMPKNARRAAWSGYVCSGTVVDDQTSGRSLILTAAHCVYDDSNKAYARNVLFIPDQAESSNQTDLNCNNDPLGCWVPSFGVVDANWTTRTFPDNIAWDYAFYVVDDSGAHEGTLVSSDRLDAAAGALTISFSDPIVDDTVPGAGSPDFTYALGYSYNEDPKLMYCAEDMTTEGSVDWWLPSCGLSGGSSGGPWVQPMDSTNGSGPIISVNSWGYTSSPGMAGPKLAGTSAACVLVAAQSTDFLSIAPGDGNAGNTTICP